MTTIHQRPRALEQNVTSFGKSATDAFGILIFVLGGALVVLPPSQAGTFANLLVDARGYGGAASTNQTLQSLSNLPVVLNDGRSWSGNNAHGWTDSSCRMWTRARVGDLRSHAHSLAEAEVTGISGSFLAQARAVSYVYWDDSFTVNAGSSLSNQLGEFTATIWIDGTLFHNSDRSDSGLYFRMSCALTDSAGGSGGITNFHGGTQLRPDILGVVQSLPLDGTLIGPGVYQVPLRFHFGRAVRVTVSCQVDADARELANVPGAGRKTGESLGSLVLRWGGISQVRVVGGDALTHLMVTSVSGFDYLIETRPAAPAITRIQTTSQGLELEWTDSGPSSYTVETTDSLRAGAWTPIPSITWPIHTNYFLLALPALPVQPAAYFRVRAR